MNEKCTIEVYWSINNRYYSFLKENSPTDKVGKNLHILKTYDAPWDKLTEIMNICTKSKGKSQEYVKSEIEKLL